MLSFEYNRTSNVFVDINVDVKKHNFKFPLILDKYNIVIGMQKLKVTREITSAIDEECLHSSLRGWSGGAMALGKLPVPGRPTNLVRVGQGPTALAVGAGRGCLDILLSSIISIFFLPLWETARYRLKYCLKGPLSPKQPTNQHSSLQAKLLMHNCARAKNEKTCFCSM